MATKKGFLLIELMIGIALLTFLILIVTHYIIEVKKVQQEAIARIEALSFVRNAVEKMYAHKDVNKATQSLVKDFTIQITKESLPLPYNNKNNSMNNDKSASLCMKKAIGLWTVDNKERSIDIFFSDEKVNEQ